MKQGPKDANCCFRQASKTLTVKEQQLENLLEFSKGAKLQKFVSLKYVLISSQSSLKICFFLTEYLLVFFMGLPSENETSKVSIDKNVVVR